MHYLLCDHEDDATHPKDSRFATVKLETEKLNSPLPKTAFEPKLVACKSCEKTYSATHTLVSRVEKILPGIWDQYEANPWKVLQEACMP